MILLLWHVWRWMARRLGSVTMTPSDREQSENFEVPRSRPKSKGREKKGDTELSQSQKVFQIIEARRAFRLIGVLIVFKTNIGTNKGTMEVGTRLAIPCLGAMSAVCSRNSACIFCSPTINSRQIIWMKSKLSPTYSGQASPNFLAKGRHAHSSFLCNHCSRQPMTSIPFIAY